MKEKIRMLCKDLDLDDNVRSFSHGDVTVSDFKDELRLFGRTGPHDR